MSVKFNRLYKAFITLVLNLPPPGLATWHRCFTKVFFLSGFLFFVLFFFVFLFFFVLFFCFCFLIKFPRKCGGIRPNCQNMFGKAADF